MVQGLGLVSGFGFNVYLVDEFRVAFRFQGLGLRACLLGELKVSGWVLSRRECL